MIGMKLDQAKGMFFDAPKVLSAVDAAARRVLSKFGAYVRTAAKSSIRKRKRISAAGSLPSSHVGLLKKCIYFGYDAQHQSVVIGPTRLNKGGSAPETLEHGGTATIVRRSDSAFGTFRKGPSKRHTVRIAPRPYMGPALKKESPKLPAMWRDSVKP